MSKPKVGFYGITGCAGCLLSVIFNEDEIFKIISALDIVAFPFIKGKNSQEPLDLCFVEGVVTNNDDLDTIKGLRARAKTLIALGTCATNGNIPALRNFSQEKELDYLKYEKRARIDDIVRPQPLHYHIKVDYSLPGCPPDREEIKSFIKQILLGMQFRDFPDPVCKECQLQENGCLIDNNKICLGPITKGGCKAVCTSSGFECYGCRGLTRDATFENFFELMTGKGITEIEIKREWRHSALWRSMRN